MCGLTATKKGKKVLLIDKSSFAGKKLLATGNGRCNLTNINYTSTNKFFNQKIDLFFDKLSPAQTLNIFEKMGLLCYADNEGRVYPISNSAKTVVDVINNEINRYKNLKLLTNCEFIDANYENGKYIVKTSSGIFEGEKLVIATGGNTAQIMIDKFKIKYRNNIESLVALKTQSTKLVEGIRVSPVKSSAIIDERIVHEEIGEILFKDSGISGIVAFNMSAYFARKGYFKGELKLDLLPSFASNEIIDLINKRKNLDLPINKMFDGLFVPQIAYLILNNCKLNENRTTLELNENEIIKLAKTIKDLRFNVKGHYNNNQVYSGGVLLSELNQNLESRSQRNLFFCGEVCDVDGLCGGYNLQWAWTSGYIVGDAL